MSRPSPMLGRAALLGLLLTLAGCADFGDAEPGVVNECTSDDACAASAQCDDDEGLCVAETSEPLEIAIEVIPPADLSGLPMPSVKLFSKNCKKVTVLSSFASSSSSLKTPAHDCKQGCANSLTAWSPNLPS